MVPSKIKKLFSNPVYIFIFTFCVELILNYLFEYQRIGGNFIFIDMAFAPTFGLMFGPAGALGFAFATLTGELIEGIGFPTGLGGGTDSTGLVVCCVVFDCDRATDFLSSEEWPKNI